MNAVLKMWKGTLVLVHRDLAINGRFGAFRRRLKFWSSVILLPRVELKHCEGVLVSLVMLAGSPGRERYHSSGNWLLVWVGLLHSYHCMDDK